MKNLNKVVGNKGEIEAQKYLKKQGYKILATNFACKLGEIDIVVQEKDIIVFVEVKSRSSIAFGRPCEAVTPYKQKTIRRVADFFLMKHKISMETNCRFDVVEVLDDEINHIKDAF